MIVGKTRSVYNTEVQRALDEVNSWLGEFSSSSSSSSSSSADDAHDIWVDAVGKLDGCVLSYTRPEFKMTMHNFPSMIINLANLFFLLRLVYDLTSWFTDWELIEIFRDAQWAEIPALMYHFIIFVITTNWITKWVLIRFVIFLYHEYQMKFDMPKIDIVQGFYDRTWLSDMGFKMFNTWTVTGDRKDLNLTSAAVPYRVASQAYLQLAELNVLEFGFMLNHTGVDLRPEMMALTQMKHQPKLAEMKLKRGTVGFHTIGSQTGLLKKWIDLKIFIGVGDCRVRPPQFYDEKNLLVSMELLSQFVVPQMGLNVNNRDELNIKLQRLANNLHSVNVDKYIALTGRDVYRDTIYAAQFLIERQFYMRLDDDYKANF